MDEISKTVKYVSLLSLYESLLSDTQKEVMNQYFKYDLSLGEIAEARGSSRAAIEDAIKKGCAKLDDFEKKLQLLKKQQQILKIAANLKQNHENQNDELIKELEEIL